jgi:ribosomal protein S18 acetylase RimI-like enzyme/DNA-binding MarR family transcriptional regulator
MGVVEVRRFNRMVTQRVGALQEDYLARGRPLGEDRVLWEIGADGCDVRSLRARLDLDSGYLSRLLRSLTTAGLVQVEPSSADARVRMARLTKKGLAERRVLDARSDELAASILEPLDERQRARLTAAMDEVTRLLTASMVRVEVVDPRLPAAQYCLNAYFEELGRRFETGFDPARSISADHAELTLPAGLLLVATLRSEPVGCGALKLHGPQPAEIKRMWVSPDARGLGLGRRLLAELERTAAAHGATAVRLETNHNLEEAIALYRSSGFEEVPAFNTEPYAHHWFEKPL